MMKETMTRPAMGVLLVLLAMFLMSLAFNGRDRTPNDWLAEWPNKLPEALARLEAAETRDQRMYALGEVAQECMRAGEVEDARRYANEIMMLIPANMTTASFGDAGHDANIVLGRIAVLEGRIDEAKQYLAAAGDTQGSPTLNSFGPNMTLAMDLLKAGENAAVLAYFDQCRIFWQSHNGRLNMDVWRREVIDGNMPDFGANLM